MELLVVVAVLSVLMALSLPVLHKSRILARRTQCQGHLRQITLAWGLYLNDYEQRFCQGNNLNHDFAGWKGNGAFALSRPLNPYLGLPEVLEIAERARVCRCPADGGGVFSRPPQQTAFDYFGNSFQSNLFLIGPNRLPVPQGDLAQLIEAVNQKIETAAFTEVSQPARVLLIGDNNWMTQWESFRPDGVAWHGEKGVFNMSFLDGHVSRQTIVKGAFVTPNYRVLPFADLDCFIPDE